MSHALSDQELVRREALRKLRALGIEPFPAAEFPVTATAQEVKGLFREAGEPARVTLAGRLMSVRLMGKASFAVLRDHTGDQQVYIARDSICPGEDKVLYDEVWKHLLHLGDFIGVEGHVFKTRTGEVTVHVEALTVLGKALRPLPVVKTDEEGRVHDAFTDPEQRYRMRYVDLNVNPGVRETFLKRTRIIAAMRAFLVESGYHEVDTPVLQPIPGGAAARPFVTHHNALDVPLYLRIANELYLKRLIVGGFEGVFEFSRNFRNEGMDRTHNPEFTIMELYVAWKDYRWMMGCMERMLERVCTAANGGATATFGGNTLDFTAPFRRISMCGSIREKTGADVLELDESAVRQLCVKHGIEVAPTMGKGKLIDELFSALVQPELIQPTFVTDFPVEMSPLCKKHRDDPRLTERFELFVNGFELANAYSELNDPIDQRERFEEQLKLQQRGDDEAMFIDRDFLRALEYGMPPTSGVGIGVDRLVMLLTDNPAIQEVLLFPQMRPEKFE
ncbi:MAG: lysine--tRNA ligase [Flavobacteriales bacterium]|nr:Lysine--tRNA ligase [Flavobacteriales bacterium]MCC6576115.1 lysine--tRNA ligase [Flavobacteriales bacterium]NUQ14887.1 lysine--tRNA ligase [Flavobacteriales bacterium]